jgi:uncharacterized membrane protein YgcG
MKRIWLSCLVVLLALLLLLQGAAQSAELVVYDTAGVLDADVIADLTRLNGETREKANVSLRVITKHFLGGDQPLAYAQDQLRGYQDSEEVLLLVMVIGEERYAVAMGEKAQEILGAEAVDTLLANSFRQPFLNRDYSRALADFSIRVARQLQSATGSRISTEGLFMAYVNQTPGPVRTPAPTPVNSSTLVENLLDSFFSKPDTNKSNAKLYEAQAKAAKQEDRGGLSFFQIALIGFVLYKIFGGRKDGRKGCGPLGWIFGTWGVSKFFGWRR